MRYADGPTAEATVNVSAPPEVLWPLVSDIHVVASLSGEVQEVRWRGGVRGPAVGAVFTARNRHREVGEWISRSWVTVCEPPRVFAWVVHDPHDPAATWRFELTPRGDGTDLRQWARLGPGFSLLSKAIAAMPDKEERIVAGRLREWQAGIDATLAGLKEMAETRA